MPAFTFTSPQGQSYTVNGPDGATPEQAFAILQSHLGQPQPAQPAANTNAPGLAEGTVRAAATGVPIVGPLLNKLDAATNAALAPALNPLFSPDNQLKGDTFSERYQNALAEQNAKDKAFSEAHPALSTGAEIAGGVGSTALAGTTSLGARLLGLTGSPNLVPTLIRSGAAGAGLNAADTALRGGNVGTGAEIGGITGVAGPLVGRVAGGTIKALRDAVMGPQVTAPQNVTRVAGVNVPLSTGQLTGDQATQMMEQGALRGSEGQAPQRVAEQFFRNEQAPAVEQARENVGRSFDPFGMQVAGSPQKAGQIVSDAVQNAAAQAKQGYRNAYNAALSLPGQFDAGAFQGVGQTIKNTLTNAQSPVIIDDVTTPIASKAIQHIDNTIGQLRIQNRADPFGQPNPQNIVGVNLAGVDQARKQLIAMAQATQRGSADNRAMSRIIDAFDGHVEDSINNGLFSGDPRALDAIRQARQAYSNYRQAFTSQGAGDDVGRAMERIVGRNGQEGATPTEVANYLYGNAKVGGTGLSVRLANRMQQVLGANSPEWSAIRQGLWSRLSEATEGTTEFGSQKQNNRIMEFLNGSGAPLAQTMFSPQERALMSRYAMLQQQLTPKPGTVNYSNTAPVLRMILSNMGRNISALVGDIAAGPAGAVAAYGTNTAAKALAERSAAGRVARSLYRSPAQNYADQMFVRQMQRYGTLAARGIAGASDQQAANNQ